MTTINCLFEAILGSGKAWDVAREYGLYVYFHDEQGGYQITDSGGHVIPTFYSCTFGTENDAYRAIFAYLINPG